MFSWNITWYEGSPVELHVALVEGHYLLLAFSLLSGSSCHSKESKLGIALTYPCKETTNAFKSLKVFKKLFLTARLFMLKT